MGTRGQLRRVEDRLIKDLEETTIPFWRLGKKYGVSKQAIFAFFIEGILRWVVGLIGIVFILTALFGY
jgi:hypothetical protein